MYSIQEVSFGPWTKIEILNEGDEELLSFIPEYGAAVVDLILSQDGQPVTLMSGPQTKEELVQDTSFFGAVLIPWPNRIAHAVYKFNEKNYVLPINEKDKRNALHGLLYDKEFTVVHKETSSHMAAVTMHYEYEGDYEGYPFDFKLELTYNLSEKGFEVEVGIENIFASPMPIGFGFHPYLQLGDEETKIDDYQLQLPPIERIAVNKQMIPTKERTPYKAFKKASKIGSKVLDDAFHLQMRNQEHVP